MVNVAASSSANLSTKALAAAGQFRAIALWLNGPLIPQGIYAQVRQDKRPGCILIVAEFEQPPEQKRLTRYICHLIWQLNSPLIEGIHLIARPVGKSETAWEHRVRVMTPALRERLAQQQGQHAPMPPEIVRKRPTPPPQGLGIPHLKTLRAFMLTGSAVAAFVFGCLAEVLLSPGQEPSLPFQERQVSQTEKRSQPDWPQASPQLPNTGAVLANHESRDSAEETSEGLPASQSTPVSYQVQSDRDRPNVVNGALEPVGVIHHERLPNATDPTVTLVFGGDVALEDLPYSDYENDGQLLAGISAYQQADVAMVSLEDPLATAATSLEEDFLDRQRPDVTNFLKEGGVDIVNLTSADILAFGEKGLTETLETLDRNGIYRVGAGRNEREARRPEILDVKGQRIAYLSYDRAGKQAAHEDIGGINSPSKQEIIEDIRAVRDEVDWLVVNYRWTEAIPEQPAEFQTNLARLAIDQGADLVVGYHPTQLQGAEIYKDRPIAYSLGDFVFGAPTQETTPESVVLQVALRDRQMKVDLIPVKVEEGQPHRASDAEAAVILGKVKAASEEFEKPMASSVVLNAQPTLPSEEARPDPTHPRQSDSFVDLTEATDQESRPIEQSSPPVKETELFQAAPDAPLLNVPIDIDEGLEIEIEPIPDGLLDDWGPKSDAGALSESESESTLPERESTPPRGWNLQPTNSDDEVPNPEAAAEAENAETTSPSKDPDEQMPETKSVSPAGAIAPYSEPLVGPLGALPAELPKAEINTKDGAEALSPLSKQSTALPSTRVLSPLSSSESEEGPLTIDVQTRVVSIEVDQD